ncbi:type VI secretion system ATPase TssH [Comamonas composti]|uniref:type VI secretion system ATPase TssH n=1 Tax=Comamonas composti TaxID=408558 RepID=UPI00146FB4EC|nr:type VI secretion system ATPase TssH [Comamonas composti]
MPLSRKTLFSKLNLTLFKALESATAFAKLRGNPYVEVVHWLYQVQQLPDSDWHRLCHFYGLDSDQLSRDFLIALGKLPAGAGAVQDFSHQLESLVEQAWLHASLDWRANAVRSGLLLIAMVHSEDLRRLLLGISPLLKVFSPESIAEAFKAVQEKSPEHAERAHSDLGLPEALPGEASQAFSIQEAEKSALGRYCTDLTELAHQKKIDPVIGRDAEIRSMVDILLRRRQNNPLLTGEAGVGKTAVVEGLALALAQQQVPLALQNVRLLSLDVGALLAGASMRGEFEARLKALLEEAAEASTPIILFIDEVHTLVGAGGQVGTGDAANLLKPALARGGLRCIGATTWSEYKKHIEKDPALTRRFQVLQVHEPKVSSAITMLRGLAPVFASHHQVSILDEAVQAAANLSHRYISDRQLPDKAISLLDTACARVAMSLHARPQSIEFAEQTLSSLLLEKQLLQAEPRAQSIHAARLHDLEQRIEQAQAVMAEQKAHWQKALIKAREIGELQQKLSALQAGEKKQALDSSVSESGLAQESEADLHASLELLGRELAGIQGEQALVHTVVDAAVVATVVSNWTGIPVGNMEQNEAATVLQLQQRLSQRVVGQDQALEKIIERVQTAKARLSDPNKPIGCFLLAGPSGVGKTETALALADLLYGGERSLITLNMSEYQESHSVSTLKGSPPGYVGYGEGGVLTEAVRRRPYSVILLDEIEKAHPDVHEVFFQVFDKGWMEDGEGRFIDFRNTLILLTSNVGSEEIVDLCDDLALIPEISKMADMLQQALRKVFPSAFLGRLILIPYRPLSENVLKDIAKLQLQKMVDRLYQQHAIDLIFEIDVLDHIVGQCGVHEYGARRIGNFIDQQIGSYLSQIWLESIDSKNNLETIHLRVESENFHKKEKISPSGLIFYY